MGMSGARSMMRSAAFAAVILGGLGVSASGAGHSTPPFTGPVIAASGQSDDTLVCGLVFVPAIQMVFDDHRSKGSQPSPRRTDRYADLEISYIVFEAGDLNHPYILGQLWNGKDSPPTSRVVVPFAPSTPGERQVLALSLDHLDKLAGPDFNLVCDVFADGSTTPRRLPPHIPRLTLKRGAVSGDRVFFDYAYFHNAVTDARVDVRVLYTIDPRRGPPTATRGHCPIVDTDVTVVDATNMKPFEGAAFSATIAPGEAFGHTIGLLHEHQPPGNSPAAPVLVVLRYTAQTAISPHCELFPSVEVTATGITRNLDIWEWRRAIIE